MKIQKATNALVRDLNAGDTFIYQSQHHMKLCGGSLDCDADQVYVVTIEGGYAYTIYLDTPIKKLELVAHESV